jgi:hypothetical protein
LGALLARLEPWRRSLVLPGFMLYAAVLGSSRARRAHAQVLDVLERRPAQMDVILTGPAMGPELMAMADQVTQLRRGL